MWWALITVLLLPVMFCFAGLAHASPAVFLDGSELAFDVPPVLEDDRVLVQYQSIFPALGSTVLVDFPAKSLTAVKDSNEIKLIAGGPVFKNNLPVVLDVPAQIKDGQFMVPLRFVCEAMGCRIDWDEWAGAVRISTDRRPEDLFGILQREFGSLGGLATFDFEVFNLDKTVFISVNLQDFESDKKWHKLPEKQRESYLRSVLNRVKDWYPKKDVTLSITVSYEFDSSDPAPGDHIVGYDAEKGWRVRNTYYSGSAHYFYSLNSILIRPGGYGDEVKQLKEGPGF